MIKFTLETLTFCLQSSLSLRLPLSLSSRYKRKMEKSTPPRLSIQSVRFIWVDSRNAEMLGFLSSHLPRVFFIRRIWLRWLSRVEWTVYSVTESILARWIAMRMSGRGNLLSVISGIWLRKACGEVIISLAHPSPNPSSFSSPSKKYLYIWKPGETLLRVLVVC